MRNALLAVDLQSDFVQEGSLPVPNGLQVAAQVARHIRHFKTEYQFVVASRDYHEDPQDHFSATPDFVNTWPPHCVMGTPGAAFVAPIQNLVREKLVQAVVSKGQHAAAYSAFEGVDARGHSLLDVLKEQRIDHIDICGIA
ncbi:MAG: isochorismatase family protein, partial [Candidatus Dormiibacterota bacterium]